ncbi:MAG: hypothetical protein ACRDTA_15140 [Pseudonocardiaceae bacterium]
MGTVNSEELNETLPRTVKERPRTYLISGGLGAALFTASGLLWEAHPFFGSLLLELGGGAFIVFLLEVVLPTVLTYTDGATRVLRVTELVWSPAAVLAVTDYDDKSEVDELFEGCERATYPGHVSARSGVHATGTRIDGFRVFSQQVAPHSLLFYYVPRHGRLRKKRVVIAAVTRLSGLPAGLRSPEQGT